MLLPEERTQAIQMLANHTMSNSMYHGGENVMNMLTYGFRGFAQFSDKELLRAITALAKKTNSFEVQNFISTIAAEKFILE